MIEIADFLVLFTLADPTASGTIAAWSTPMASILSGDRQLLLNGQQLQPDLATLSVDDTITWMPGIHSKKSTSGNVAFTDGHVESIREKLKRVSQRQGPETSGLVIP